MAMEIMYDHGYVTVKGETSKQLPKFYEYMSDMGFVISGILKKMGPPKKDEDIEDLKKYIQGEKTALVPEARINEKGNYAVTAPKNPNESKGRIALLIFREKDAIKFLGTLKPIKLLASQNIGKKVNIFNEDKKENRAVLEDYGYTLEKTGSEGNDICYKVLPSSNRYKDVPYPDELTDVFDFYVRSVLFNKGYEILDFTPYRYSLEESSYREILDRAKELGVNYLCVINYAALSEWKGRGMSWNSSYYWTFGIGAYVVCNISVFNMTDASDKYDTIFYGITPFKWMVEKSEKSACLISTKPDTDISEIKNENANFFVFSNRAIRKEIVNQESKNVAGYAGEDDPRPESLKYKLLHMLKQ